MIYLLAALFAAYALTRGRRQPSLEVSGGDATLEGDAANGGPCTVRRRDGGWTICVNRSPGSPAWVWEATSTDEATANSGIERFGSQGDALANAWITLLPTPVGQAVERTITRSGMRLSTNAVLEVVDFGDYIAFAEPIVDQAMQSGDDPPGIVISLLLEAFGSDWNPLRVRIAGEGLGVAAARVAAAPPHPSARAAAIVGGP